MSLLDIAKDVAADVGTDGGECRTRVVTSGRDASRMIDGSSANHNFGSSSGHPRAISGVIQDEIARAGDASGH